MILFLKMLFMLSFFCMSFSLKAQPALLSNKHRSNIILGQGGDFGYYDDGSGYEYRIIESIKYGFFVSNRLVPFIGVDLLFGKAHSSVFDSKEFLYAVSTGSRYYFTKKNLLFLETSLQAGSFNAEGSKNENFDFAQIGLGAGISLNLASKIGDGNLAFEMVFRSNYNLIELPQDTRINGVLSSLGTSFGLNYTFAPKSVVAHQEPAFHTLDPVRVNSFHILKADIPLRLSYCYEWAIGKETVIDLEVTAKDIGGLFSDDHYFFPGIKIEPRYYYGYNKRNNRGQTIINNSSDFLAIETSYQWLWKYEPTNKFWQFSLIPKWGLRRAIWKRFIVELAVGCSFFTTIENKNSIAPHIETSFGFTF
jgi:hypothetical protein